MALHEPNNFQGTPCCCHICYGEIRDDQFAIEHSGEGLLSQTTNPSVARLDERLTGYVALWFHPECATVMAVRLAHDVMRAKHKDGLPMRVVDGLKSISKINQAR